MSSLYGTPKFTPVKPPKLRNTSDWVYFAVNILEFAKSYGDVEEVLTSDQEIDYIQRVLANPIDYNTYGVEEADDDSDKDIKDEDVEKLETRTTRAQLKKIKKKVQTFLPPSMSAIKLSKEMKDKLVESKLQQAISAQQNMTEHQRALVVVLHSCLELDMKNKMWQTPAYREAYEQTRLLHMWRILKQVCLAGFTEESLQRYAAQFAKLKQQSSESFNTYYINFKSKLEFLGSVLPREVPHQSQLTALFIEGLDDARYGTLREALYQTKESNLTATWAFPETWNDAATYFKTLAPDPQITPYPTTSTIGPTVTTPTSDGVTMAVTPMTTRAYNKTSDSTSRQPTPRKKILLNVEQHNISDADSEFSYTGVDGRKHIMPRWIPIFDQSSGRRYSQKERVDMANDYYWKKSD